MAWQNLNICYSKTETFTTVLKPLSAYTAGEVIIFNMGSLPLKVYDTNSLETPATSATSCFMVPPSGEMTFRGLTNSNQVSALYDAGSGLVTYRTQYFSSNPLNTY